MRKLAYMGWFFVMGAALGAIRGIFESLGDRVEPQLFATGHEVRWWGIVLTYWLIDTAAVLCFAWFVRWPIDTRPPSRISFLQPASDLAVLIFLLHLVWLATDKSLSEKLASIGLDGLSQFFLIIVIAWIAIGNVKYRRLRDVTSDE
jgi:hypothetical protein